MTTNDQSEFNIMAVANEMGKWPSWDVKRGLNEARLSKSRNKIKELHNKFSIISDHPLGKYY